MNIKLGVDNFVESENVKLKEARIGLITNYSGVDSKLRENIRILKESNYNLVKIFAPEHGLYGIADGEAFEDMLHPVYNVPVISLYGDRKKPRSEDLEDIDVLIYDIQDVGLRYYTYIYTLAYSLEAASENSKKFIVLDRPNPLGGELVLGNRIPGEYASFVGDYELPIRYGLTPGEIGYYFIKYLGLSLDYQVYKMENYSREMYFPETGLNWNLPSPALPNFDSVVCYSGGCFVEAVNISEGRGTSKPFQMYGAPWIDMRKLYKKMKEYSIEDFDFRERAFVPFYSKYKDEVCFGLEFFPKKYCSDFIPVMLQFLKSVYEIHNSEFKLIKYADVSRLESLTGDRKVMDYFESRIDLEQLMTDWNKQAYEFSVYTQSLRIY